MERDTKEQINVEELTKDMKVENVTAFSAYLKEVWKDLAQRSKDKTKGVNKITFTKYYELPGLISERLYRVFDKNNNGYIDGSEFISGMKILFTEGSDLTMKFIFEFYDFDKDGYISREDIRTVLSYIPLKSTGRSDSKFSDQAESQTELNDTLEQCFKKAKLMDFKEFCRIVENESSDIFLFVLMFLLKKRPFTSRTLEEYGNTKQSAKEKVIRTPKPFSTVKMIASPSLNSKFLPAKQISSSPMMRRSRGFNTMKVNSEKKGGLLMQLAGKSSVKKETEKKASVFQKQASAEEEKKISKLQRKGMVNLKEIDKPREKKSDHEDLPLEPAFKQTKKKSSVTTTFVCNQV